VLTGAIQVNTHALRATRRADPFDRMKGVVRFYLSGFYKKPKGLKKPYNPILGEVFRCCWVNRDATSSRTYYIAEQVVVISSSAVLPNRCRTTRLSPPST
jgi:hypothetical protein